MRRKNALPQQVKEMDVLKNIKGAIFDLDGTLLDSLWIWKDIDRRFLAKRGIEVPPDYMRDIGTMEYRQAALYTVKRFGLDETPEALMDEWSEMSVRAYASELKLKPKVREFLSGLRSRGVKLAVATSATREMCVPALKNNGVYELFENVSTTFEIGKGKDFPDVYLAAAEKLGLQPSECAVFEDSLRALETAKKAGFVTVGVFDKFSEGEAETVKARSDMFVVF